MSAWNTRVKAVESTADGRVRVQLEGPAGERETLEAEVLLVATGRASNSDTLDLARRGIEVDDDGLIVVDDTSGPPPTASSRWATCAHESSSSMSPTRMHASCNTTCCIPTR